MNTHEVGEKVMSSLTLGVIARIGSIAAPVLVSAILVMGYMWLDMRFDGVNAKVNEVANSVTDVSKRVDSVQDAVDLNTQHDKATQDRLLIAEETIKNAREDRERWQAQVTDILRQLQVTTGKLSENVAATNATLVQMQYQRQGRNALPMQGPNIASRSSVQ